MPDRHRLTRMAQLLVLLVASFTMLGAGDPTTRFRSLGHQLVCQCGCGQILIECNHVGCPVSPVMLDELHTQVATNLPNGGVLNFFVAKYGAIVLAAPIRGGFDTVAWIVPFAVLALGIAAVLLVLRHWKRRHAEELLASTPFSSHHDSTEEAALRDRIRNDTTYGH